MAPRSLLVLLIATALGCTGEPAPRAVSGEVPTERILGVLRLRDGTAYLERCGSSNGDRPVLPSPTIAAARTLLAVADTATLFLDVEAAPTPTGVWEVAVLHRAHTMVRGAAAACADPIGEAIGSGDGWWASFARESLLVIRLHAGGTDTLRRGATRAPAIDGTVLYRSPGNTTTPAITLSVSPIAEERGLREGTAQVNERRVGCRDAAGTEWRNASARLTVGDSSLIGCAAYVEPLRDPTKRRRRF